MTARGDILLIEDDPPMSRILQLILKQDGFSLRVSPNRETALELMLERRPDAIVMDYLMGGMSAEDFIVESRDRGFEGPIVLCTAMPDEVDLPVTDIIRKPFDPDDLQRRLMTLLPAV